MGGIIETRFLVLRKTPYADTSLVVAGVAPGLGQLHFLVRGARRLGRRQFPVADLFRELLVQYRPGKGELFTWSSADLLTDFGALAREPALFAAGCTLARLALANVQAGLAQPRAYAALLVALRRLAAAVGAAAAAQAEAVQAALCGTGIVLLEEHGLLPDYAGRPELAAHRARLLAMGEAGAPPPPLDAAAWDRLREWLWRRLRGAEFRV